MSAATRARLRRLRTERRLISAGRRLDRDGLVRGPSGNLSARVPGGFVVSVKGSRLGRLRHRDLVAVGPDGAGTGARAPSSEVALHAAIYRRRPDVGAIVHTHSPYATAWAAGAGGLDLVLAEAGYHGMGSRVGVAPYAPAGGLRLARLADLHLADGAAVLLERHGAVAVGADPRAALEVAQSLEHQARVAWLVEARAAGVAPALLQALSP